MFCHMSMMRIVVLSRLHAAVGALDVTSPEESGVCDQSTNLMSRSVSSALRCFQNSNQHTAALAMNSAYAKDPLRRGMPYCSSAALSRTPPLNTLATGYDFPLWLFSVVDMKGSDREFHALE